MIPISFKPIYNPNTLRNRTDCATLKIVSFSSQMDRNVKIVFEIVVAAGGRLCWGGRVDSTTTIITLYPPTGIDVQEFWKSLGFVVR